MSWLAVIAALAAVWGVEYRFENIRSRLRELERRAGMPEEKDDPL